MADYDTLSVTNRVGIGTESPLAQLHIASSTTPPQPSQAFLESSGALLKITVDGSGASIGTDNAFPLRILTDNSPRLSITDDGRVGIGTTTTPTERLEVDGNVKANYFFGNGATLDGIVKKAGDTMTGALIINHNLWVNNDLTVGNAIATKEVNASGTIKANRFEGDGSALTGTGKWSDGSFDSIYYNNGNVGIGTTTFPREKLEVVGKVKATDLDVSNVIATHQLSVTSSITTGNLTIKNANKSFSALRGNALGDSKYLYAGYLLADSTYVSPQINTPAYVYGLFARAMGGRSGIRYGVYGLATEGQNKYGGFFETKNTINDSGDVTIGVYGKATGPTSSRKWGVVGSVESSGRGEKFGVSGSVLGYEGTNYGVCGWAFTSRETSSDSVYYGVYGRARGKGGTNYGVYGTASDGGTNYAGYFKGNVHITGSLTRGKGSFLIDHPLDPLNKTLRHNFVESPEDLCLYRGKVKLNSEGSATVQMPDYFAALTKEEAATVNLTPIGKKPFLVSYEWNQEYTAFTVFGEPNAEVAYLVLADRDDPVIHQLREPVEQEKGNGNFEQGKLLYPEAYGYSQKMGVDYHEDESFPSEITETIELEDLNSQIQD